VQTASGAPPTRAWKRGLKVKGNSTIQPGTAIATFDANGKYTNSKDLTSHAAIYTGQNEKGLQVWDQWLNGEGKPPQPVHQRTIRFAGLNPVNDGDAFYIINLNN
jgi:hypothetical protein